MEIILVLIGTASLVHLWIVGEPSTVFRQWIGFDDEEYESMNKYKQAIHRLLNCHLCLGFWVGLAVTGNLYYAGIVSIVATLIEKITRPTL